MRAVWSSPQRMGGEICFRGTRIPVQMIREELEEVSVETVIDDYPALEMHRDQLRAYLINDESKRMNMSALEEEEAK